MGQLLVPRVWCRQSWCRRDAEAAHRPDDGCSCDAHGDTSMDAHAGAPMEKPRRITLTAKAARLSPFFCRACGGSARQMVEYPSCFFRCEPCAAADRWPEFPPTAAPRS